MENPWADNWAEQTKDVPPQDSQPSPSPVTSPPTWPLPPSSTNGSDEVGVGAIKPVWSTASKISWVEESDPGATAWEKESAFEEPPSWQPAPATFDGLPRDVTPEFNGSHFADNNSSTSGRSSPSLDKADVELPVVRAEAASTPLAPVAVLDDGDGFGSFATVADGQEASAWAPTDNAYAETSGTDGDVWGKSWENPAFEETEASDEWEMAKQEKAKQDKHVPPERLNGILREFDRIATDLFPESNEVQEESEEGVRSVDLDDDNVVSGSVRLMLIPEGLSLEMYKPFAQTFVAKREVEALKLSRNDIVTRKGPMSMYMASKGSTSWETAIKTTTDQSQADATPAGWKIVSKEDQPVDDGSAQKKSTGSGILSFFSRRTTNPSTVDEAPRPSSPGRPVSKSATHSPRVSVDAATTSPVVSAKTSGVSSAEVSSNPPVVSNVVASPISTLDYFPEERKDPPPSVVSRFLGRFSRSRSTNARDSLTLSSDDLEFLSDVVPTTQENASQDDQLKALSNMINSKAPTLPTALPPPLAPPPPPQAKRQPAASLSSSNEQRSSVEQDLFSLFDSPAAEVPMNNSNKQSQPLPSIPSSNSVDLLNGSISFPSSSSLSFSSSIGSPSSTVLSVESTGPLASLSISATRLNTSPPLPPPKTDLPGSTLDFGRSSLSSASTSSGPSRSSTPASNHRSMHSLPTTIAPLPPPPGSRSRTPISSSLINPLPPPPPSSFSRSNTLSLLSNTSTQLPHSAIPEVDDDFSDFVTSPSHTQLSPLPSFSAFSPPSTTTISATVVGDSSIDEWGDFATLSTTSTSAKLVLTATSEKPSTNPGRPTSQSISTQQRHARQPSLSRVTKADHQRTLSLMETVASRGNTWRSPPSPLPEALPPPDSLIGKSKDPFEHGVFASQQEKVLDEPKLPSKAQKFPSITPPPANKAPNAWRFPPLPSHNAMPPQNSSAIPVPSNPTPSRNSDFFPPEPVKTTPPFSVTKVSNTSTKGGLSAQDLAFFEGL